MTFILIILSLGGLLVIPHVLLRISKQAWIRSSGIITSTKQGFTRSLDGKKSVRTFTIAYEYVVENRAYCGTEIVEVDRPYHEIDDAIANLENNFKKGDLITIYHAKNSPALCSLKRSVGLDKTLSAVGLAILTLIGFYIYFAYAVERFEEQDRRSEQRQLRRAVSTESGTPSAVQR